MQKFRRTKSVLDPSFEDCLREAAPELLVKEFTQSYEPPQPTPAEPQIPEEEPIPEFENFNEIFQVSDEEVIEDPRVARQVTRFEGRLIEAVGQVSKSPNSRSKAKINGEFLERQRTLAEKSSTRRISQAAEIAAIREAELTFAPKLATRSRALPSRALPENAVELQRISQIRRENLRTEMRRVEEEALAAQLTFHPKINASFQQRRAPADLFSWHARQKQNSLRLRQEIDEREQKICTFVPKINKNPPGYEAPRATIQLVRNSKVPLGRKKTTEVFGLTPRPQTNEKSSQKVASSTPDRQRSVSARNLENNRKNKPLNKTEPSEKTKKTHRASSSTRVVNMQPLLKNFVGVEI
mgnify:CR=1 FL=1